MSREQEIVQAKLTVLGMRGFWWVLDDLQKMKGPECEIIGLMKQLERNYLEQSKEKAKWEQKKLQL